MNKEKYLEQLEYYLKERHFDIQEIDEILDEYSLTIDEAIENDVKEEDLIKLLGNPKEIVSHTRRSIVIKRVRQNKFVALSPFIAVIIYFVLGFGFNYWKLSWLVFLLIPISGIISSQRTKKFTPLLEVMPILALAVFLVIGLVFKVWHPTWLVFLLIPAISILNSKDRYKILSLFLFILGPSLYLLSYYFYPFEYNWLLLSIIIVPSIYSGLISFRINGVRNRKLELIFGSLIALVAITYVLLASIYNIWHPLWLIFLLIPIASIILSMKIMDRKIPMVALSPFIAVTLFVLIGELFNAYQWSWLFFLIIPVSGILSRKNGKQKYSLVALSPFIALVLFFIGGEVLNGYQWAWLFFLIIPISAIITNK